MYRPIALPPRSRPPRRLLVLASSVLPTGKMDSTLASFPARRVSPPPDPRPPLERPPPPPPLERPPPPPDPPPVPPLERPPPPPERLPFPEPFLDFCAGAEGLAAASTDSGRAGRESPIFGRAARVGGIDGTALGAVGVRVAAGAATMLPGPRWGGAGAAALSSTAHRGRVCTMGRDQANIPGRISFSAHYCLFRSGHSAPLVRFSGGDACCGSSRKHRYTHRL